MNKTIMDLDIYNYSIPELKQLLKIKDPITPEGVKSVIQKTINCLQDAKHSKYVRFFEHVQIKLLVYLDENPNVMITNYGGDNTKNQPRYDLLHEPYVIQSENSSVIIKNTMPTEDTFVNKYPTGVLNPIRRHKVKRLINIDTLFRSNYNTTMSTDFLYTFPISLNNIISMRLSVIEIPNIWYNFSSVKKNNIFTISTFNASGSPDTIHSIVIPAGNYTSVEIVDAMNNMFINMALGLQFLHFDINPYTNQTIIRARNQFVDGGASPFPYDPADPLFSPTFSFTIDFRLQDDLQRALYKNLGWMLGFRNNVYSVDITNTFINQIDQPTIVTYEGYLESLGVFGSSVDQYLFLSVDDFNKSMKNSIISESENSYLEDSLLGRITINSGANTIVMDNGYDNIFKKREYFGPVKIKNIRVRILDKFGEVVDLNNNDYSFALEFTQIYS